MYISGDNLYLTEDYIPYTYILSHKCIVARVVNVCDGDTIRVRHIPNGHKLYPYPQKGGRLRTELYGRGDPWKGKLRGESIRIRLYGIDCPELSHFGKPAQPFADEALRVTKDILLNRIVFIRLLSKDQYGRLIAQVLIPCTSLGNSITNASIISAKTSKKNNKNINKIKYIFPCLSKFCINENKISQKDKKQLCQDICQVLLMQGYAVVYKGQNEQYAENEDRLNALQKIAQDEDIGMWSGEVKELPAEFKRRMRNY